MYYNRSFIILFSTLFTFFLLNTSLKAQTQNDDSNGSQPRTFQTVTGSNQVYFVDQLGLGLLQFQLPAREYIQHEHFKIGPQDVLSIDISGPIPITARGLAVNSQGTIYIPMAGNIDINNMTLEEAKEAIRQALSEELNEFELSITIDRPRRVDVNIHGDIPFPGRYIVPAGTRLDAVAYAGLIDGQVDTLQSGTKDVERALLSSRSHSLRNISIIRSTESNEEIKGDLVRYFRNGDRKANPYLFNGDQIKIERISETSPVISISGAVHSSQELEYQPTDHLDRLLELAGGYLEEADTSRVLIHRTENRQVSRIELELTDENRKSFELRPNDRVVIPYSEEEARSYSAWVRGEAIMPGNYPIENEQTTLKDLLEKAGGTTGDALEESAYIVRGTVSTRNVRPSTSFNLGELQRSSDQLLQGFEYLQNEEELNTENRVHIDLTNEDELAETVVNDGDMLFIPKDYQSVILYGQVNSPGNYTFSESMNVRDYIQKAGGMTIAADNDRVFVIKAGSRAWKHPGETTLQSGDIIFVDRVPYDELQAARNYDIQLRNLKRSNLQLVLTTVSTITAVITTVVAIRR